LTAGVLGEIVGAVCGGLVQACFGIINGSVVGLFFSLLLQSYNLEVG